MEPDGDIPPLWSEPTSTTQILHHPHRRRRAHSSPLINPVVLILLIPILTLLLLYLLIQPFISQTSQILKPSFPSKKSWDSLHIFLVLFAIICGFLAKKKDEIPASYQIQNPHSVSNGYDNFEMNMYPLQQRQRQRQRMEEEERSVLKKEDSNGIEMFPVEIYQVSSSAHPAPLTPKSPPPPETQPLLPMSHKRSRSVESVPRRRKAGKLNVRNEQNLDSDPPKKPPPPPLPPPPPPLPTPPSKIIRNYFKKNSKNKRVYSVSTSAAAAAPPLPPPTNSIFNNIFKSKRFNPNLQSQSSSTSSPPPPPSSIIKTLFKTGSKISRFKSGSTNPRQRAGKPPLHTKSNKLNREAKSPLNSMPPLKMREENFVDFVSSSELEDVDVVSDKWLEGEEFIGPGPGPSVICPSPDVNVKADNFIARLKDEWRTEIMNSR